MWYTNERNCVESETREPMARAHSEPDFAQSVLDGLAAQVAILSGEGRILSVNQAWRTFAEANSGPDGLSGEGANYLDVCDGATGACADGAGATSAGIRAVLNGEREMFSLEYPYHSPDEQRWFLMRVTRFPGQSAARASVSHENITERRQAEESLRRRVEELARTAEDLERKNQELDQFAYVTSHDLKAPLRGIANLSRWIEEDGGDDLNDEVRGHLELMRGRVHRMEAMIDALLQYSRVGRAPVRPESVDVGALLAEVIDLVDPPQGMTLDVEPQMPILTAERLPLQQVFQNLIVNAIRHHDHPERGHVKIGVRTLGDAFEFVVADDGPGIAPQYHEKVFVIFQTLEARDKKESTGVGLALVKKIVEAEGGRVRVDSDLGRGAAFRFTWPKSAREKQNNRDA